MLLIKNKSATTIILFLERYILFLTRYLNELTFETKKEKEATLIFFRGRGDNVKIFEKLRLDKYLKKCLKT